MPMIGSRAELRDKDAIPFSRTHRPHVPLLLYDCVQKEYPKEGEPTGDFLALGVSILI